MRGKSAIVAILITVACVADLSSQVLTDSTKSKKSESDTVLYIPPPDTSLVVPVTDSIDLERHLLQNPTTALFKSMFVPGLGQIGNHRYIKAAAVIGLQAWLVGSIVHYGHRASNYWNQYSSASDTPTRNAYYSLYATERDQRNKFTWFAGILTFVSMFDAYVDAHLSGAPTSKHNRRFDISLAPDLKGGANAQLAVRF
jgi:hypothetical protein